MVYAKIRIQREAKTSDSVLVNNRTFDFKAALLRRRISYDRLK